MSNYGASGEVDIILPAISYNQTRTILIESAQVLEISPPSGEVLELSGIDLTADDDGAQYYCHVGYNDVGLDTGITLVNIAPKETAPTTVNATPIRTRRLFSQASAGAKKFLDHTLVNTAGPTDSEGSKDPETPETPTNPDKPKSDNGAKTDTKVKTTTTAKNLANTGDQTFALVATAAAAGATLVVIALIMLIKRRKTH